MIYSAEFSEDGNDRYILNRIWDKNKPTLGFILLNPSTANKTNNDQTINKIINYVKKWKIYGGFFVCNIYSFITSDKTLLNKEFKTTYLNSFKDLKNRKYIKQMINSVDKIIYAWGYTGKEPKWLSKLVDEPYCINTLKNGQPGHPSRAKSDLLFKLYNR